MSDTKQNQKPINLLTQDKETLLNNIFKEQSPISIQMKSAWDEINSYPISKSTYETLMDIMIKRYIYLDKIITLKRNFSLKYNKGYNVMPVMFLIKILNRFIELEK